MSWTGCVFDFQTLEFEISRRALVTSSVDWRRHSPRGSEVRQLAAMESSLRSGSRQSCRGTKCSWLRSAVRHCRDRHRASRSGRVLRRFMDTSRVSSSFKLPSSKTTPQNAPKKTDTHEYVAVHWMVGILMHHGCHIRVNYNNQTNVHIFFHPIFKAWCKVLNIYINNSSSVCQIHKSFCVNSHFHKRNYRSAGPAHQILHTAVTLLFCYNVLVIGCTTVLEKYIYCAFSFMLLVALSMLMNVPRDK